MTGGICLCGGAKRGPLWVCPMHGGMPASVALEVESQAWRALNWRRSPYEYGGGHPDCLCETADQMIENGVPELIVSRDPACPIHGDELYEEPPGSGYWLGRDPDEYPDVPPYWLGAV